MLSKALQTASLKVKLIFKENQRETETLCHMSQVFLFTSPFYVPSSHESVVLLILLHFPSQCSNCDADCYHGKDCLCTFQPAWCCTKREGSRAGKNNNKSPQYVCMCGGGLATNRDRQFEQERGGRGNDQKQNLSISVSMWLSVCLHAIILVLQVNICNDFFVFLVCKLFRHEHLL